jgi:SAM-dependent methyltransferase
LFLHSGGCIIGLILAEEDQKTMPQNLRDPAGTKDRPEVPAAFSANYGKVTRAKQVAVEFCLHRRPKKVLDCPAQNVWLCEQLIAQQIECVAADIVFPEEPIVAAEGLLTMRKVDMNEALPFPPGEFDAIICLEGIEHCENPSLIIRELSRCLRPGGVVFLSCPNVLNIKSRFKYLLRGSFYSFPHLIRGEESPDGHMHLTPAAYPLIEYLAETNGLTIAERYCFGLARKYIPFLPLAGIVKGLVHLGAFFVKSPKRKALQHRLVSSPILLSDQLLLRLEKPA